MTVLLFPYKTLCRTNAENEIEFFRLPTNRVLELGSQVEIEPSFWAAQYGVPTLARTPYCHRNTLVSADGKAVGGEQDRLHRSSGDIGVHADAEYFLTFARLALHIGCGLHV